MLAMLSELLENQVRFLVSDHRSRSFQKGYLKALEMFVLGRGRWGWVVVLSPMWEDRVSWQGFGILQWAAFCTQNN